MRIPRIEQACIAPPPKCRVQAGDRWYLFRYCEGDRQGEAMRTKPENGLPRLNYFLRAALREYTPWAVTQAALRRLLPTDLAEVPEQIMARVQYYNQLTPSPRPLPTSALRDLAAQTRKSHPFYYFDLMTEAKGFGPNTRVTPMFGDITHVPDTASLVKSRPIAGDVAHSVLLKLDRFRHFYMPHDPYTWDQKSPTAVWRGRLNDQAPRITLAQKFADHPSFDIGAISDDPDCPGRKPWLTVEEQLKHRYVLVPEGNDVATALKWVMGSQSIALSPRLEFETWFMEGQLIPDHHYVEVRPDMSDLEEKVAWLEDNPAEAAQISRNASAWMQQFCDPAVERLTAILVMQKYIEMTGGLEHAALQRRLFT